MATAVPFFFAGRPCVPCDMNDSENCGNALLGAAAVFIFKN